MSTLPIKRQKNQEKNEEEIGKETQPQQTWLWLFWVSWQLRQKVITQWIKHFDYLMKENTSVRQKTFFFPNPNL
jgi:hypothetical protein